MKYTIYILFFTLVMTNCKNPKPKSVIKTTFAGFEINYELTEVDAEVPKTINYESGNSLKIPEKAFVDASGNKLEGAVDIRYREFHNPADIIAGNVNLALNNKKSSFLEPVFLFDFSPKQNGQEVFIDKNKSIQLEIPNNLNEKEYDIYYKKDKSALYSWQMVDKKLIQTNNKEGKIIKTINFKQNGLYAVAKVYQMKNPLEIKSDFLFQGKGLAANVKLFHITGKDENTVIEYTPDKRKTFRFDPNDNNTLIAVLPNDQVAVFSKADFSGLDIAILRKNKKFTFQLQLEKQSPKSGSGFQQIVQKNVESKNDSIQVVVRPTDENYSSESKEYTQQKDKYANYSGQCVLLVTSAAKFPLYQNCANGLETVGVGSCGSPYRPRFEVDNGTLIKGEYFNQLTIYPSNLGICNLTVFNAGSKIGTQEFKVLPVPPPTIFLGNSQGTQINSENPIPLPRSFQIVVKSDENFAQTLPKEANYRVTGVEVFQFRGGRAIQTRKYASGDIDMSQFPTRPGDGFQFKCTGVVRLNSKGYTERAKILNPYSSCQVK